MLETKASAQHRWLSVNEPSGFCWVANCSYLLVICVLVQGWLRDGKPTNLNGYGKGTQTVINLDMFLAC